MVEAGCPIPEDRSIPVRGPRRLGRFLESQVTNACATIHVGHYLCKENTQLL